MEAVRGSKGQQELALIKSRLGEAGRSRSAAALRRPSPWA